MPTANGSAIHTSRGRNQAYTFIDQVRVLVAEMKCAERLPRALLLCSVPLVRTCTALELFRAEIIARKCTARICIVRTYPERLLVSADAGSRNSTMRRWGCGAGGKPIYLSSFSSCKSNFFPIFTARLYFSQIRLFPCD